MEMVEGSAKYVGIEASARVEYDYRAILCLLMDELDVLDWQGVLNNQTKKSPQTLYFVLKTELE